MVENTTSLQVLDSQIDEHMNKIMSYEADRKLTKKNTSPNQDVSLDSHSNSIRPNVKIRHEWAVYREQLLLAQYHTIDLAPLAVFWEISKLDDGSVIFSHELGDIIDHGDKISTNSYNYSISAETMIMLAISKKWTEVSVNGTDEFKLSVYKEAINKGISCEIKSNNEQALWLQAKSSTRKGQSL